MVGKQNVCLKKSGMKLYRFLQGMAAMNQLKMPIPRTWILCNVIVPSTILRKWWKQNTVLTGLKWFIGIDETIRSLREIAVYFNDPTLIANTEKVIAEELEEVEEAREYYKEKLHGKTAAVFVGGSRSHHYQMLLADFGMKTVIAGYEFAHRDDYEGLEVRPNVKVDADSRNIEELTITPDDQYYHLSIDKERFDALKLTTELEYYKGMFKDMGG